MTEEHTLIVRCHVDTNDWKGGENDKQKCEDRLKAWFYGLSQRTQLSIYYAQRHHDMCDADKLRVLDWACPFLRMVEKAENRIWHAVTKNWFSQPESGFNFRLETELDE